MNLNAVYVESVVAWHALKERTRESVAQFQEGGIVSEKFQSVQNRAKRTLDIVGARFINAPNQRQDLAEEYGHIFRRKSRWELILLSGAVCGIEFCYAAETAFVTPILMSLGLDVKFVTMMWCLSPLIGFFATPLLGSLSDRCTSELGRRRPFILVLSLGILAGLVLVPNGHSIGIALGDVPVSLNGSKEVKYNSKSEIETDLFGITPSVLTDEKSTANTQSWSVVFTVIGAVLLDFCSDACQSPSRTYLLDVTVPEDHGIGLSTFTMMAGLGGSMGYLMGGVNWEATILGRLLGGHVRAVFTFVTILFLICLLLTITSFKEIPLSVLRDDRSLKHIQEKAKVGPYRKFSEGSMVEQNGINDRSATSYGSTDLTDPNFISVENHLENDSATIAEPEKNDSASIVEPQKNDSASIVEPEEKLEQPSLKEYLLSIIYMPKSLRILCLTNLFCWMSLVCYSLYFTDFVGESVFRGDPTQPEGSQLSQLYEQGVRFGCYGMALYSISCSCYSCFMEKLIRKFGAKKVYVGGQLAYSLGMAVMAICRHKVAVILLSPTAGLMYATLFTMPYLLVAHYHCMHTFEEETESSQGTMTSVRGIGTDVATVSSMVFLSQFVLSLTMGSVVALVGSSVVTVCAASFLSACGALCATQVFYLDL